MVRFYVAHRIEAILGTKRESHIHTCTHTHTYTHIHTHAHSPIHTYTHTHIHAYTHTHIHTYTHTHIHTFTYRLTHTHIPTYTHTHTQPNVCSPPAFCRGRILRGQVVLGRESKHRTQKGTRHKYKHYCDSTVDVASNEEK